MTHHIELDSIRLETGHHAEEGRGCVMDWTARFAGLPVTDHPPCTSPVLTAFAIALNDGVDDEFRQRLVPFIPRLVGTSGDAEADERRAWMATDWLVRRFSATWLRRFGMAEDADALEDLPALTSAELAAQAQPVINEARRKAYAARDAARVATSAATRDAAPDATSAATSAAAWAAAWAAARDAAWAAAWAARGTYSDKYDAAYKAARTVVDEALAETVQELREDALRLFSDMIDAAPGAPRA